jgi:type VI secretion system secreted protein Hcp
MKTTPLNNLLNYKYLLVFLALTVIAFIGISNFFKGDVNADISQVMLRESPTKRLKSAYIKIEGIDGESTRVGTKGWIEISEFTHSVKSPRDAASGQATGRRQYEPIIIRKSIDKSSPLLAKAIATNQVIPSLTVEMYRESPTRSGRQEAYMRYELKNVMVSSFQQGGVDTDGNPMEEVSFNFEKVTWTYLPTNTTASDDWLSPQ